MWTSIVVYNLWILGNLKLHELDITQDGHRKTKKDILTDIEDEYNCCGIPTLKQAKVDKVRREFSKLPRNERSTKEFPSRPWKPRPKIPIRRVSNKIMILMLIYTVKWYDRDIIQEDPPNN